jgi:outer membrane protein assembly factor BamB
VDSAGGGGVGLDAAATVSSLSGRQTTLGDGGIAGIKLAQDGNVVAAGGLGVGADAHWLTAKLAGATGAMLWRQEFPPTGYRYSAPRALDVTTEGDLMTAGAFAEGIVGVRRFSGATGSLLWETVLSTPFWVEDVVIDSSGDVFVAGRAGDRYPIWDLAIVISGRVRPDLSLGDAFRVARLRASDGAELWAHDLRGSDPLQSSTQTYPGDSLIAIGAASDGAIDHPVDPQCTHPSGDTEAPLPSSCGLGGFEVLLTLLALRRVVGRRRAGG